MTTIYLIIAASLGLIGFLITERIIFLKKKPGKIYCPIGNSCDEVIRGKYSKILGITTVEVGRIYYLLLSSYFLLSLFSELSSNITLAVLLVSGGALLLSIYLTILQLVAIKKWCSWCLFSGLVNLCLFIVLFLGFSENFFEFLHDFKYILEWIFAAFTIIGTLATTAFAVTFIKFLKDFKISKNERNRLNMFSQTAWTSIAFTVLSSVGLILTDTYREITGNSEFLVMGIIVGVLIAYEIIMNMVIGPHLVDIHFGDSPKLDDDEHLYKRRIAFVLVGVGIESWYLLLLFSTISWHDFHPLTLIVGYICAMIVTIFVSLIAERILYKKSLRKN